MKIMIVDDHEGMRQLLRYFLARTLTGQIEVIECESGEEAVKVYTFQHPDCVLMDIELRKMNGFQATELIYKHDQDAKIIIVSSYDTPTMRRKAGKLPLKGFVSKQNLSGLASVLHTLSEN